jgi:DNA-binding transcriptional ArsR family regulator
VHGGVHRPAAGGLTVEAFDVLGDPVRRRILELLAESEHSSGQLTDVISREFGISQPAVSMQLRVLRENGFARSRAEGPRRIYAIDGGPLAEVDAWLGRFRSFWEQRLDALGTEIARGKRRTSDQGPESAGNGPGSAHICDRSADRVERDRAPSPSERRQ